MKKEATVSRAGALHVLLVLTLSMCLVSSSAEARKWWHWRHFYRVYDYGDVARSGDFGRRDRVSEVVEMARARTGGGGFGAVIDRLIRGCVQQAAELQNLPFDEITRIVAPDDTQRSALEALRASATAEAQRVSAQCPQDEPAPPGARLEAVEQAIDTATATFAAVDPPLRAFYAALDDEQKARLLRDLTLSKSRGKATAPPNAGSAAVAGEAFQAPPTTPKPTPGPTSANPSPRHCADGRSVRSNAAWVCRRHNASPYTSSLPRRSRSPTRLRVPAPPRPRSRRPPAWPCCAHVLRPCVRPQPPSAPR